MPDELASIAKKFREIATRDYGVLGDWNEATIGGHLLRQAIELGAFSGSEHVEFRSVVDLAYRGKLEHQQSSTRPPGDWDAFVNGYVVLARLRGVDEIKDGEDMVRAACAMFAEIIGREGDSMADGSAKTVHSADYTSAVWYGTTYQFNKTQAACIELLWTEWGRGGLSLSEKTIGDRIGASGDNYRLAHTFRTKDGKPHPAWDAMIQSVGKGIFRLSEPNLQ